MWSKRSWLAAVVLLLFLITVTRAKGARVKTVPVDEEQEQSLRQSQNTFVQWVLSLLPQRPSVELSGGPLDSGNVSTTASPEPSSSPAKPSVDVVSSPAPATSMSTTISSLTSSTTSSTTSSSSRPPEASSSSTTTPAPSTAPTSTITTTTTTSKPTTTTSTAAPATLTPARNCSECVCGVANINKRIVGGRETEVHQYPWMAMLLYGGRFYCGASLINDQYLVTASHCVYGFRKERLSVRLLEHDRKMSSFHKIDRKVLEIITHPKYNIRTYDNDIAIVKLDEPVEMTELLHPVCLPTPGKSFKGETAIVTGWGALKVGGPSSDTLQEVLVPIMSQDDCRKSRYGSSRITDNMLCAGFSDGKKDSCQGDSGGPLHVVPSGTREHQLAGVVSWGEGCARPGYPGVYARVNRYGTWIKTMTRNACICIPETKKIKK